VFERVYRQRLEADLARWQADGVIAPAAGDAIRGTLRPMPEGVTVATVVGVVAGLLIAAAFLAFVAANWTAIARPLRFAILLAGIAGAYGVGAWFDRTARGYLSDLAVAVGSIIFGAAIALIGQMYHLDEDFAGGLLLWAGGALVAAALTGSRGALAVALAVACAWSGVRVFEMADVHLPFLAFWLIAAALAIIWSASVAHHLVAIAAVAWLIFCGFGVELSQYSGANFTICAGAALLLGAGLGVASSSPAQLRAFGVTLSVYGAFALALIVPWSAADLGMRRGRRRSRIRRGRGSSPRRRGLGRRGDHPCTGHDGWLGSAFRTAGALVGLCAGACEHALLRGLGHGR
jgi:uncharacterized membrane protein